MTTRFTGYTLGELQATRQLITAHAEGDAIVALCKLLDKEIKRRQRNASPKPLRLEPKPKPFRTAFGWAGGGKLWR